MKLSATQIEKIKKFCLYLYYLETTGIISPVVNKYTSFGETIHKVLSEKPFVRHFSVYPKLLKKYWRSVGYETKEEEKLYFDLACKYLWWYFNSKLAKTPPYFCEKDMSFFIGDVEIFCKLDRLDIIEKRGKRYFIITDYKTGKAPNTISDLINAQSVLYRMAVKNNFFCDDEQVIMQYYFLRTNSFVTVDVNINDEKKMLRFVKRIVKHIKKGEFFTKKKIAPECLICPAKNQCSLYLMSCPVKKEETKTETQFQFCF